jgi:Protein of unknown function (DUF3617)
MKTKTLFLALAALACTPALRAADRFQSGQWETTVSEKGAAGRTSAHCLTAAQVKSANGSADEVRASLEKGATDLHCSVKGFKMEGDTVAYTYACAGRSTEHTTTYHGDRYESVVTSTGPGGSHVSEVKGRRLGECP